MYGYGQAEEANLQKKIADTTDSRGVIPQSTANLLRQYRSAEEFQRYDSIVIGKGASKRDVGWFENFADFANSSELQWFTGRSSGVGTSYSNQNTERTDWAQDLHMTSIEFLAPTGNSQYMDNPLEADLVPSFFVQELPHYLGMRVVLSDSDEIAKAPASHFPGRYGTSYPSSSGSPGPVTYGGNSGDPNGRTGWVWPVPVTLAAKARITVTGRVDEPALQMLRILPEPGHRLVPQKDGSVQLQPNWYTIRITHSGPRYLQLRGGRSSS